MLSQFHLNTRYNYNYIKRSLTTNFPNYVRATYPIWVTLRKDRCNRFPKLRYNDIYNLGYIKKRSLTTDFPNYVKATYTKLGHNVKYAVPVSPYATCNRVTLRNDR